MSSSVAESEANPSCHPTRVERVRECGCPRPGVGASCRSAVILPVPSVIIPNDLNYLINPKHRDFSKLKIGPPTDFAFDQRLFK
jgi:RES domain-containing protein